jgi:subfamily B ATP-binding cassette protein MsbA
MTKLQMRAGGPLLAGPREPPSKEVLLRLAGYLPPLKWKLFVAALCTIVVSVSSLGIGGVARFFLDAISQARDAHTTHDLDYYALLGVGLFLVKGLFNYAQQYLLAGATQRLAMRLRNQIFARLQAQSMSFYDTRKTGQLMAAITTDVPAVQNGFTAAVLDLVSAPVTILGGIGFLFYLNWRLTAFSLICLPATAWLIMTASRRMRRHTARLQAALAEISEVAEETLAGQRAVKAFGNEPYEVSRFEEKSRAVFSSIMRTVRVRAAMGPLLELIGAVAMLIVLWFGGREIVHGSQSLTLGGLTAFVYVLKEIADAWRNLGSISLLASAISAAAGRIFALLDLPVEIEDRPGAKPLERVVGRVAFEHVHFAYRSGIPVLEEIHFTMEPGQVVAVVGKSGAGKTTIAALIPRFYDATAGAVRLDGTDVRDATLASLRRQIGIVPQDPHLFAGTVRENILYGRLDATEAEVIAAAKAANAHGFISELPSGYDTVIGERGVRLSGGQRQRISIARAILRDPRILILDEATSSLDTESEALVQDALQRLVAHRTTLVIAHRLSTIRHADVILVVDQGRIVERGTHDDLIQLGGVYASLYRTQFRYASEPQPAAPLTS